MISLKKTVQYFLDDIKYITNDNDILLQKQKQLQENKEITISKTTTQIEIWEQAREATINILVGDKFTYKFKRQFLARVGNRTGIKVLGTLRHKRLMINYCAEVF